MNITQEKKGNEQNKKWKTESKKKGRNTRRISHKEMCMNSRRTYKNANIHIFHRFDVIFFRFVRSLFFYYCRMDFSDSGAVMETETYRIQSKANIIYYINVIFLMQNGIWKSIFCMSFGCHLIFYIFFDIGNSSRSTKPKLENAIDKTPAPTSGLRMHTYEYNICCLVSYTRMWHLIYELREYQYIKICDTMPFPPIMNNE